ncbi:hypothetical protein [Pseudactinotalea sp.]|uniref:hypothetical protein n=1 Tax=Pseudactinotalea sp. TaxID=1926260 RepID=UPI003B3B03C7
MSSEVQEMVAAVKAALTAHGWTEEQAAEAVELIGEAGGRRVGEAVLEVLTTDRQTCRSQETVTYAEAARMAVRQAARLGQRDTPPTWGPGPIECRVKPCPIGPWAGRP